MAAIGVMKSYLAHVNHGIEGAATVKEDVCASYHMLPCQHIDFHLSAGGCEEAVAHGRLGRLPLHLSATWSPGTHHQLTFDPNILVTAKRVEVRMGKGTASTAYWACHFQLGQILYEIEGVTQN